MSMNPPNPQDSELARRLTDLTLDEKAFLKNMRKDGFNKGGFPASVVCGALAFAALSKKSSMIKIFGSITSATFGNMAGTAIYVKNNIQERAINELPQSSFLRKVIENPKEAEKLMKEQCPPTTGEAPANPGSGTGYVSYEDLRAKHRMQERMPKFDEGTATESNQNRTYTSYDDLREKHRLNQAKQWSNTNIPTSPQPPQPSATDGVISTDNETDFTPASDNTSAQPETNYEPGQKIRYNKYGDPIYEE